MAQVRVSFRDPAGQVCRDGERVLRWIHPDFLGTFEDYEQSEFVRNGQTSCRLIRHSRLPDERLPPGFLRDSGIWVEHPRIPFQTFPEEWCWGMLKAAAELTLELALEAEREGFEIKDANPRNIMFQGCQPCFLDPLSFRHPLPGTLGWLPLGEFLRGFLFPLAVSSRYGLRLDRFFLSDRDGISHNEMDRLVGFWGSWRAPFFRWLRLPKLMEPLARGLASDSEHSPVPPPHFLRNLLQSLRTEISRLHPPNRDSEWTDYEATRIYSAEAVEAKHSFIAESLKLLPLDGQVLDLGTNDGEFSLLAAAEGFNTISIDRDPGCVDRLFEKARQSKLPILPMVMDLGRPTPPQGWAGLEQAGFLERASNQFDLVMALALVHHLRFPGGVPFALQFQQLAQLTRRFAVVEWIPETDSQVVSFIKRFRYHPSDYNLGGFEEAFRPFFKVRSRQELIPVGRVLYLLERL